MKVIFICSPYTAESNDERHRFIQMARHAAARWWSLGWAVICPATNSAWMSGVANEHIFYQGYFEILRRCDAIYLVAGWGTHAGCIHEEQIAQDLKLEIFREEETELAE